LGDYDWLMSFAALRIELQDIGDKFKAGELGEEEGNILVDKAVKNYYDRWVLLPKLVSMKREVLGGVNHCAACQMDSERNNTIDEIIQELKK